MSREQRDLAWSVKGLSGTQKLVLLCLAEHANESGTDCFPSVSLIAERTCLSTRTVQMALRDLESMAVATPVIRRGTSTSYRLSIPSEVIHTPRIKCTSALDSPPQQMHPAPASYAPPPLQDMHPTPAGDAPKPSINRQVNRQLTVNTPEAALVNAADLGKRGVAEDVALEFLAHRRRKKAPLTPLSLKGIEREAAKAGVSLEEAMRTSVERGWSAFKAEWVQKTGRQEKRASDDAEFLQAIGASNPWDDGKTIDMETGNGTF